MVYFTVIRLQLGEVGLVWELFSRSPELIRIVLPADGLSVLARVRQSYRETKARSHPLIEDICRQLEDYDRGNDVCCPLPAGTFRHWSDFTQQVWAETGRIPRGKVSTYGQIASNIAHPRAARAVGTALRTNPFPLLIPCHRVVLANGELGNYSAGGPAVKQRLLSREGVLFDRRERVVNESVFLP